MFQAFDCLYGLLVDFHQYIHASFLLGSPELNVAFPNVLHQYLTSLNLLTAIFLMGSPPGPPFPFAVSSWLAPSLYRFMGLSFLILSQGKDFAFHVCWTPRGSCWCISPARPGPSECQHNHLMYQQLLLISYNLQTCWVCALSHHAVINEDIKKYWTSLLTALQLHFVLLIRTLWAQQFRQFSGRLAAHLI